MEIVELKNANDRERWDRFVESTPHAVHYHLAGWKEVLENTYGNRTIYLMAVDRGATSGILPLAYVAGFPRTPHLVSLPYLSYAGLCAEDAGSTSALIDAATRWHEKLGTKYIELHNLRSASDNGMADASHAPSASALTTRVDKVRMVLPLPADADALWKKLDPKVRNQVRKATKSGLRVEIGGAEFLGEFYAAFAENMRDLGSPVHSIDLFKHAFAAFPSHLRLFMIFKDRAAVGGGVLLTYKGLSEVPWASSRREFFQYCPNNLLYWEILKYACERGSTEFDFGRSTRDSGTYRFKEQWGAEPRRLYWQYCLGPRQTAPDATHSTTAAQLMIQTWKKLPLPLANMLGPAIRGRFSA